MPHLFRPLLLERGTKEGQPEKKPPAKPAPPGKATKAAKPAPDALTPSSSEGPYLLLDLSADANDNFEKPIGKAPLEGGQPDRIPTDIAALRRFAGEMADLRAAGFDAVTGYAQGRPYAVPLVMLPAAL